MPTDHSTPAVGPAPPEPPADSAAPTGPGATLGSLGRLLTPRHIALYGGETAAEAVRQCRAVGYRGAIWPVNPRRTELEGLPCYRDTAQLPAAPDAAFIAVPGAATVQVLGQLSARGAGGAVCHAAGFAEDGGEGARLEDALRTAAGDMPVLGPNCLGLLNYLDGTALWADQQGGSRTSSGVAVITQSGNIGQNLTMQRRALPLSYLVTAGNSAVTGVSELMTALLEDPRVTAIGLHLEGIADAAEFSRAALTALHRGVPVVALKTGSSALGARSNLSHTSSLAGSDVLCDALFQRTGVARVSDVDTFLETLKLLHVHGALPGPPGPARITSASCSGGEAALVADTAQQYGVELPALPQHSTTALREVLGDRVHIRNPLDYHTFIWGDFTAQRDCFTALLGSGADANLLLLDLPRADRCAGGPWRTTLEAYAAAQSATGAPACVVSSLAEGVPEPEAAALLSAGIAPMQGIADCLQAVAAARRIGAAQHTAHTARPLEAVPPVPQVDGGDALLDEYSGKRELARYGVPVPPGAVTSPADAPRTAEEVGFPVVVKARSADLAHKTEAGGVRLGLRGAGEVTEAVTGMSELADEFLVERMVPDAVAELLVGVRRDPVFGPALTLGAGGVLVELLQDTATLLLPASRRDIEEALATLRLWPLLQGFRGGPPGDVPAAVDAVRAVAAYVQDRPDVTEVDVNPLLVQPPGQGATAADVLIRHADTHREEQHGNSEPPRT